MKYLVSPEYCLRSPQAHAFDVDIKGIEAAGAQAFFAAGVRRGDHYATVGSSRTLAIAAAAKTLPLASDRVEECIAESVHGDLEHRHDVAQKAYIDGLVSTARGLRAPVKHAARADRVG